MYQPAQAVTAGTESRIVRVRVGVRVRVRVAVRVMIRVTVIGRAKVGG